MIITLKNIVKDEDLIILKNDLEKENISFIYLPGDNLNLYLSGSTSKLDKKRLMAYPFIEKVTSLTSPFRKVSRLIQPEDVIIKVGNVEIGRKDKVVMIAGPCAVESREQIFLIAGKVKELGADMLRGGAYKPRTSPYSFRGLEEEGIKLLSEAGKKYNLPVVSELTTADNLDLFIKYVDVIQIGSRNMQNYELLRAVGKINKPILLKRGFAATVEEWLLAAEYIMNEGNSKVILCERGIRTFENATRNTLDLSVVPLIHEISSLPIIVDPSHGTGKWSLIEPMSLAGIASGADGLIIEVHHDPEHALSDGGQSLTIENFKKTMVKGKLVARALNKKLGND